MESMGMNNDDPHLHVVMLPSLGFGHLFPFVELSNRLDAKGVKVTFLSPPSLVPRFRSALVPHIPIFNYQLPAIDGLPAGAESTNVPLATWGLLSQAVDNIIPEIINLIRQLSPNVVVYDYTHHWIPSFADSLNITPVYFSLYSAIAAANTATPMKFRVGRELLPAFLQKMPARLLAAVSSLKEYEAHDALSYFKHENGSSMSIYERMVAALTHSPIIALKSAVEIERRYINEFSSILKKPVLLTGTLMAMAPSGELDVQQDKWLSKFPANSVVFFNFGSETRISHKQAIELLSGLEMSGSPFFAVVSLKEKDEKLVNDMFGERAGGRGMVQGGWVQQQLILRHPSVGCYVCHGGHSSIMEAAASGCQIVLVPQKGDQFLNSKLIANDLKAGVLVERRSKDGWFTRQSLCKAVRMVMVEESEKAKNMRANLAKLKEILLNEEAQQKYIQNFIAQLKEFVSSPRQEK